MSQININTNPGFDKILKNYMRLTGISQKAKAIREAVREALEFRSVAKKQTDFRRWLGLGLKGDLNKNPRFRSDDDLWKDD